MKRGLANGPQFRQSRKVVLAQGESRKCQALYGIDSFSDPGSRVLEFLVAVGMYLKADNRYRADSQSRG